jgi:hypothetical protein
MGAEQIKVGSALDLVQDFLEEIRGSEKKAETGDGSDPTSLPYKGVSNNTQKATTGARAAENREDVKKSLGSTGVTGQEDASSAPNVSEKTQSGDMQRLTADDGAPQTIKAYPPKPGDKGPGDETYDKKYASLRDKTAAVLAKYASAKPDDKKTNTSENAVPKENLATPKAAVATSGEDKTAELQKRAAAEKYREEAEAGYAAAQILATNVATALSKQAAARSEETVAMEKIAAVRAAAEDDAGLFIDFMRGHLDAMSKKAEPEPEPEPAPEEHAEPDADNAGGPPDGDADDQGGVDPAAMMGSGGMPPGAEGGGGESPEAKLEAIAAALEEAGITPEELAEAIAAVEQQQGGGGMPPGAGGMPSGAGGGAGGPPIPGM